MNRKQQKTLEAIFEEPVRSDVAWKDIEKLLETVGAVKSVRRFLQEAGIEK